MTYQTIAVNEIPNGVRITFTRVKEKNTLTLGFMRELNEVLDQADKNDQCRLIVLEGAGGYFCTGMDFNEAVSGFGHEGADAKQDVFSSIYMDTLRRFSLMKKVIISKIEGQVMAGGVGLAAASDLVFATPGSTFALPETLWGLLPACVMPYLIRRVGFQTAYRMTLTTLPVSAQEAYRTGLVDELNESPDETIRKTSLRLKSIESSTIAVMKQYFRKMWIITEDMEKVAVSEICKLVCDQTVQRNLKNFIENKKLPWEA